MFKGKKHVLGFTTPSGKAVVGWGDVRNPNILDNRLEGEIKNNLAGLGYEC